MQHFVKNVFVGVVVGKQNIFFGGFIKVLHFCSLLSFVIFHNLTEQEQLYFEDIAQDAKQK